MQTCLITREIGIDMGHRVTNHAGKCKNVHGHRYTIQVTLEGSVLAKGADQQDGMLVDFGFIKDLMMERIDYPCDHGLCLWVEDPLLAHLVGPLYGYIVSKVNESEFGSYLTECETGKLYVLSRTPTAENLAYHWYCILAEAVVTLSDGRARLHGVRVWETPNCFPDYRPTF